MTLARVAVTTVRKPYDPTVVNAAPVGSVVEDDIRLSRDEKGNCIYRKVGEVNVSEYVESFKNGCTLSAILDRIKCMPLRDKVAYLQQTENGVSADMTHMPTDGSDAFLMLQKYAKEYPEVFERISKGEDYAKVFASVFGKTANSEKEIKPASTDANVQNDQYKEVTNG